jgi:YidC/Oxa1 family membrane protein insertase
MFDKPLQWIGSYLAWLDRITGSYVVAILLFALTVEIVLLPLAIKRQKTSIQQAKLSPKVRAIQKKYAGRNDQVTRQKMQQEIMEMQQEEGFNQFGGCLTLLIQLPIIMALYNIIIEEAAGYFAGTKSLEDTVAILNNRAGIYISESR